MKTIGLVMVLLLLGSACTPLQTIKPLPDFVTLAIHEGDEVVVVTQDYQRVEFEVNHVDAETIGSTDYLFTLTEIRELYLRSKDRPPYPCGGTEPLGCSVPGKVKKTEFIIGQVAESAGGALGSLVNTLGANWHSDFEKHFYPACVQHDFCYRHGKKTYGHDKKYCDEEFNRIMLNSCDNTDIRCEAAAKEFTWAVTNHAVEGAYRVEESTYCEYDGPDGAITNSTNQ